MLTLPSLPCLLALLLTGGITLHEKCTDLVLEVRDSEGKKAWNLQNVFPEAFEDLLHMQENLDSATISTAMLRSFNVPY